MKFLSLPWASLALCYTDLILAISGTMAEILVDNGVKAIWNFAHTDLNLKLPKDVIVENVHLSESLMRLSYNLTRYEAEHPKNN